MKQNGHCVEVQKTDKIEINEKVHGLPPGNGVMKEYKVADYFCPDDWSKDGVFVSVEEGQPLWFDLRGNGECACLPAIQRFNPVASEPANLEAGLSKDPKQNYMRLPEQRWLDGYSRDGRVFQFVITKEGEGLAVAEYVLPKHMQDSHAVGFAFYDPKKPKSAPVPDPPMFLGSSWEGYTKCAGGIGGQSIGRGRRGRQSAGSVKYGSSGFGTLNSVSPDSYTMGDIAADCASAGAAGGSAGASDSIVEASAQVFCSNLVEPDLDVLRTVDEEVIEEIPDAEVVDTLEEHEAQDLAQASMGQGGRIGQDIVTDDNTVDYYHEKPSAVLTIYFALPGVFKNIMKKGKRQDKSRKEEFKMSGKVGGVQVPLI